MSITRDQLIQFIEKPCLLKEQTIGELKEIVDEFPFFQSAQLLYTYNLYSQANFRYAGYLKTCSIYSTDRTVLYQLLQPAPPRAKDQVLTSQPEINDQEISDLFELAEENQITKTDFPQLLAVQLSETESDDFDLLSFDQPESYYRLEEFSLISDDFDSQAQTGNTEPKLIEKVDLIDQFIKVNPTIQPRIENIQVRNELSLMKDNLGNENDEFITETLSRIYLKQGHYQKAIDSFNRLSLKFPEKSVYFAQQIEEIKKSLN